MNFGFYFSNRFGISFWFLFGFRLCFWCRVFFYSVLGSVTGSFAVSFSVSAAVSAFSFWGGFPV